MDMLNKVNKKRTEAFLEKIPSVFIISSPFQALCAIEAIRNLNVSDYRVVIVIRHYVPRVEQIKKILKEENVQFYDESFSIFDFILKPIKSFFLNQKYNRVFIGERFSPEHHIVALEYIKKGKNIVYLDDGNKTLPILYNINFVFKRSLNVKWFFTKKLLNLFNINWGRTFYTIYSDVNNPKYDIMANDFKGLVPSKIEVKKKPYVLFIGTNPEVYCHEGNMSYEMYMEKLSSILKQMRNEYSDALIEYVPHGLDRTKDTRILCDKINISYLRIDVCIEYYLLKNSIYPSSVLGIGSTALYTIKKMFPNSCISNIALYNSSSKVEIYDVINNYFEQHGIVTRYC